MGLRVVSAFGERRLVGPPVARRAFGVPPGGPFDRLSAALANALVGLPGDAPLLEIALGPVVFEATEPTVVGVVGGPDGAFPLRAGDRLEVRPVGARAYMAVSPHPNPLPRRGEEPSVALPTRRAPTTVPCASSAARRQGFSRRSGARTGLASPRTAWAFAWRVARRPMP